MNNHSSPNSRFSNREPVADIQQSLITYLFIYHFVINFLFGFFAGSLLIRLTHHHHQPNREPSSPTTSHMMDTNNDNFKSNVSSPMFRNKPHVPPKLSRVAMFDDMCRASNSLVMQPIDFQRFQNLLKNYQETRKKWAQALRDLRERDSLVVKLQSEKHEMNIRMNALRMAFAREVKDKENLAKMYEDLKKKMDMARELMSSEENKKNVKPNMNSLTELMTILNNYDQINRTEDDSNDGLLFDKSDDNINVDFAEECRPNKKAKFEENNMETETACQEMVKQKSETQSDQQPEQPNHLNTIDEDSNENVNSIFDTGFIMGDDKSDKTPSVATIKSNGSTLNRHHSTQLYSRLNLLRYHSKLEPDKLDSRAHKFQEKKAFKPHACTVCSKNIGFCSAFFVCIECHGVAHPRCRDLLPKPCLPHLSGQAIRKMVSLSSAGSRAAKNNRGGGKLLMIGDFTTTNTRPCVPALLIHCCNEIDRRIRLALEDKNLKPEDSPVVGLYRVCAVESETRELRNKILEAKHGIPNLTTIIDVHIICGSVKMFLRDLDDSVLTTVLWHDFVRAADHVVQTKPKRVYDGIDSGSDGPDSGVGDQSPNEDDFGPMDVLKEVIVQLPVANRDSLAFLMLHLRNVASAERITRMNTSSLSSIFAPTIVGNSEFRQLSSSSLMKQNEKQVIVMQALFLVEESFWSGLLKDQDFFPFKEDKRRTSLSVNGATICSKLAKISSSNLKALMNEQDLNAGTSSSNHQSNNLVKDKYVSMKSIASFPKQKSVDKINRFLY